MFMTIWQITPTEEGFAATETRTGTHNADVFFKNTPTGRPVVTAPTLEALREVLHAVPYLARFPVKRPVEAPVIEEWMG